MDIRKIDTEDKMIQEVNSKCQRRPYGSAAFSPTGVILPVLYENFASRIRSFEVREDDFWVITFPKCGTTWTQEMVWLLGNSLNFQKSRSIHLEDRFIFLEYSSFGMDLPGTKDTVTRAEEMTSPRFIKSHLPLEHLPTQLWTKKPKIIYVYRNPKDVVISYYHHFRMWDQYNGTQSEFMEAFLENKVNFCPFWNHVLGFWKIKDEENLLFSTFESMKKDLLGEIKRTASFLKLDLPVEKEEELVRHLSFSSMKENTAVNFLEERRRLNMEDKSFYRKGEAGEWKTALTAEEIGKFDSWSNEKLKASDFPYYH